uniref:(northern house mosquito) hypothetical protein n=1 Tax=Culex pipiens TaxID=7175 RepID=A0A8D8AQ72_CULPI
MQHLPLEGAVAGGGAVADGICRRRRHVLPVTTELHLHKHRRTFRLGRDQKWLRQDRSLGYQPSQLCEIPVHPIDSTVCCGQNRAERLQRGVEFLNKLETFFLGDTLWLRHGDLHRSGNSPRVGNKRRIDRRKNPVQRSRSDRRNKRRCDAGQRFVRTLCARWFLLQLKGQLKGGPSGEKVVRKVNILFHLLGTVPLSFFPLEPLPLAVRQPFHQTSGGSSGTELTFKKLVRTLLTLKPDTDRFHRSQPLRNSLYLIRASNLEELLHDILLFLPV